MKYVLIAAALLAGCATTPPSPAPVVMQAPAPKPPIPPDPYLGMPSDEAYAIQHNQTTGLTASPVSPRHSRESQICFEARRTPMSKENDDPLVEMTLELPASLVAEVEEIRKVFGEEVLTDLVIKAHIAVKGRLALRGG